MPPPICYKLWRNNIIKSFYISSREPIIKLVIPIYKELIPP
nr:MAG TPA: hypothetical protein [Caudoviricetes sp.]